MCFAGRYHVLGGALSALDGITPERLNVAPLWRALRRRGRSHPRRERDGGGPDHGALSDGHAGAGMKVTRLAHGVPVGGELDYLDEGTLSAAFKARRAL